VCASSAAFTAGLGTASVTNNVGYGTVTATGGTLYTLSYSLSTDNPPIVNGVTVVMVGDTTTSNAYVGFNGPSGSGGTATVECSGATLVNANADTSYTCNVTSLNQTADLITQTDVALAS
jgi:hypothetical protein